MNASTSELETDSRMTRQLIARLRDIESRTIVIDHASVGDAADVDTPMILDRDVRTPDRYFLCLASGAKVAPLVQRLAIGFHRNGIVVAVGRTDASGCLWIRLPEGEYGLRLVLEVRDQLDVDVLEKLDDEEAREQRRCAADDLRDGLGTILKTLAAGGTVTPELLPRNVSWTAEFALSSGLACRTGGRTEDAVRPALPVNGVDLVDDKLRCRFEANRVPSRHILVAIQDRNNEQITFLRKIKLVLVNDTCEAEVSLKSHGIKTWTGEFTAKAWPIPPELV